MSISAGLCETCAPSVSGLSTLLDCSYHRAFQGEVGVNRGRNDRIGLTVLMVQQDCVVRVLEAFERLLQYTSLRMWHSIIGV